MAMAMVQPTGKTSDEITGKARNGTRKARTHTSAPDISPKLKSLQDLCIRVNPKLSKEIVHHASLWVDRCLHFCLHGYKVIHPSPELSDPLHRVFPNHSPEDEGELFVHSNLLEQVHIVYMSVTKLSLAERLIHLHLLGAMDGNVITVHRHRNIIMCKI
jgi:hypothetical protein